VKCKRKKSGCVFIAAVLYFTLYVSLFTVVSCAPSKYDVQQGKTTNYFLVASWYGPDFYGRPTSSGEIYNMNALTCAHKEYPFGTKLKVTNTSNNKSVTCIVNDRGPFIKGRDIDLSYAAAKEIDLVGPGIASVLIEIQGRDTSYIRTVKVQSTDKRGPFAIQVGAFSDSINAVRLKVGLRLKYVNAHIQEAEIKGVTWYRVRVGNFDQFSQAMETAEKLGQEGYPALIVKADLKM